MRTFANVFSRYRFAVLAALISVSVVCLFVRPNIAYAAGVDDETKFVFNTFSFLIWGALVMWMCAGFTMLESGSVRTKNASTICLKNIGIYSIAGIAYFVIGYNLMYVDIVGGFIGSFNLLYGSSADEIALLGGDVSATAAVVENGYSTMSDWFFQMVFVATAASIVSGTLAERVKMWPFFLFTLILTAFIYPVVGAWTWGGGWLDQMGFKDFAGSTIVHSTGGWAALAGVLVVGPRLGKFRRDGTVRATPPSNVLVVTLGVFILWFGWFGFNAGSQLALGSAADVVAMSNVMVNTNLAAAAGVMAALAVSRPILGRMDLIAGLNGAIAGLVSVVTLGVFILWFGWFGFNAGSQLALGSAADVVAMSNVMVNTNLAAAAGVMAALAVSRPILGRMDLIVSVTAAPDLVDHHWAIIIGAVGGIVLVLAVKLLEKLKLDDVVGAIPAHLFAGIWGTLAVAISGGQILVQLIGVLAVGAFVFAVSWVLWKALDMAFSVRVSRTVERMGLDSGELGLESYPEFVLMPEDDDEED